MDRHYIDSILENMALEGITHFSPHYVCQRAGTPDLKAMTEHLFFLVDYRLKVYFEVECPDGDSDFAVTDPRHVKKEIRKCSVCQMTYIPDPDNIWIAFDFLPEFIDQIKKKHSTLTPNPSNNSMMLVV